MGENLDNHIIQYRMKHCINQTLLRTWELIFDTQLKFVDHINNKINKAHQILGIIKRNFIYLTPHSFLILCKSQERSHLEYGVGVWSPHHEYLIEKN